MGQHLESKPDSFVSTHCTPSKQSCSPRNLERWDELLTVYTSHCPNLINILENFTFLVTCLQPNTHIVASRCADKKHIFTY